METLLNELRIINADVSRVREAAERRNATSAFMSKLHNARLEHLGVYRTHGAAIGTKWSASPEVAGEMLHSPAYGFSIKSAGVDDGRFTGYASVFGPPADLQGDLMQKGCFAKTLRKSGGRVPILMGHIMARIVGFGVDAVEDSYGLKVTGEFTMDSDEGRSAWATAKHAARCGHELGLSIGYLVPPNGSTYDNNTGTRTIREVELLEYSVTPVPASPRSRIRGV
jgi:HK97 family phage prohead protease